MTGELPDRHAVDRMLKRAVHMEKRAAQARVGSNERRKLLASAGYLRAAAQQVSGELSRLARERLGGGDD